MKGSAIASIAVAAALVCGEADAAEGGVCPPAGAPWLRLALAGDGFATALRKGVVEQLGADLRARSLALCDAEADTAVSEPLADIELTLSSESVLSLEVRDSVTDKRMTRELALGAVPRDAIALSITLAAEELLRASWIEAALAQPPSPASAIARHPVPPAVQAVNAEEIARMTPALRALSEARQPFAQAALVGAIDRATGGAAVHGQTDVGADARFAWGGRLAFGVRAGVRAAPDVTSAHGAVRGRELIAGVSLTYAIAPRRATWGAEIGARADVLDVQFSGIAPTGAQASSDSALGAALTGTLGVWRRVGGPWRIVAEADLGAPVHSVTATDGSATTTGVSGLAMGGALGLAATLPE